MWTLAARHYAEHAALQPQGWQIIKQSSIRGDYSGHLKIKGLLNCHSSVMETWLIKVRLNPFFKCVLKKRQKY